MVIIYSSSEKEECWLSVVCGKEDPSFETKKRFVWKDTIVYGMYGIYSICILYYMVYGMYSVLYGKDSKIVQDEVVS